MAIKDKVKRISRVFSPDSKEAKAHKTETGATTTTTTTDNNAEGEAPATTTTTDDIVAAAEPQAQPQAEAETETEAQLASEEKAAVTEPVVKSTNEDGITAYADATGTSSAVKDAPEVAQVTQTPVEETSHVKDTTTVAPVTATDAANIEVTEGTPIDLGDGSSGAAASGEATKATAAEPTGEATTTTAAAAPAPEVTEANANANEVKQSEPVATEEAKQSTSSPTQHKKADFFKRFYAKFKKPVIAK